MQLSKINKNIKCIYFISVIPHLGIYSNEIIDKKNVCMYAGILYNEIIQKENNLDVYQ